MRRVSDYADEWYLPTDDGPGSLYVVEHGHGPTVLTLHGGPGHDHSYLVDALAGLEDRYRFVYFDQRGSLRSPVPVERLTLDAVVNDIARLVDELGGAPLPVVGHSAGCLVAAAALQRHPGLFSTMLLIGSPPLRAFDRAAMADVAFAERPEIEAELARLHLDRPDLSAKEATWAWRVRFAGVNLYHVDRWRQMAGGRSFYNARAGEAITRSFPDDFDYRPVLQAHGSRVTLLHGDHDYVDPGGTRGQGASGAVRLVLIPRAGHNVWVDEPEQFERAAAEALAGP
jgi:proline iminopeptidase